MKKQIMQKLINHLALICWINDNIHHYTKCKAWMKKQIKQKWCMIENRLIIKHFEWSYNSKKKMKIVDTNNNNRHKKRKKNETIALKWK